MLVIKGPVLCLLAFALLIQTWPVAAQDFVFSAPPRGTADKEALVYKPIAAYLSRITGKRIVYQHPDNWLNYQSQMQKDAYDLVFDGPHFVAWRMAKTKHKPLVRLPGKLAFVVAVQKGNTKITNIQQVRGRKICVLAPPNLATLTMLKQFDNPMRQPFLVSIKSFPQAYERLTKGDCIAAVMRDKMFNKLNKGSQLGRIIYRSQGIANQAFSAGPKFSVDDKERIKQALLSAEAKQKMAAFHARFNKKGKPLEAAMRNEYQGLAVLLKDVWGFELTTAKK